MRSVCPSYFCSIFSPGGHTGQRKGLVMGAPIFGGWYPLEVHTAMSFFQEACLRSSTPSTPTAVSGSRPHKDSSYCRSLILGSDPTTTFYRILSSQTQAAPILALSPCSVVRGISSQSLLDIPQREPKHPFLLGSSDKSHHSVTHM